MTALWYAAAVRAGQDAVAAHHLTRQGFGVQVLRTEKVTVRRGRRVVVPQLLLPGYVFVRFDRGVGGWQVINNTRGVRRLLPVYSDAPVALKEGFFEELTALIDQVGAIKVGQALKIIAGPFNGLEVVCNSLDKEDYSLCVLMTLLSRDIVVRLGLDDVVPC
jgi:transcriptional antiterminator RfaH